MDTMDTMASELVRRAELLEQLRNERDEAWGAWEKLNLPTFERSYEEDYADTIRRLNAEGYYDGLNRAVAILESLVTRCDKCEQLHPVDELCGFENEEADNA